MTGKEREDEIRRFENEHRHLENADMSKYTNRLRRNSPKLPTKKEIDYANNLHKSKGFDVDVLCRSIMQEQKAIRPLSHRYSYDDGRKVAWTCAKSLYPDYAIDTKFLKALFPDLIKYFLGFDGMLDTKKGLLLVGGVGRGKTSLFRIFQRFASRLKLETVYKIKPMMSAVYDISEAANVAAMKSLFKGNVCFDDLGQEASVVKLFGNEIRVFEEIMTHRYNNFIVFGDKTHLSTNLTIQQINDVYGERVFSRINEMMNIIPFKGIDRRINN